MLEIGADEERKKESLPLDSNEAKRGFVCFEYGFCVQFTLPAVAVPSPFRRRTVLQLTMQRLTRRQTGPARGCNNLVERE